MKAVFYFYTSCLADVRKKLHQSKLFECCFLVLSVSLVTAQSNPKIDSLKQLIKDNSGEQKSELLVQLAEQFYTISPDSVYAYASQSLEIAKSINSQKALARSYNSLGVSFYNKRSIDSARYYYEKSLTINRLTNNTKGIAVNSANLGAVLYAESDYIAALEYYIEASKYEEALGEPSFGTLTNIGLLLSNLDRHKEALDYLNRDLKVAIGLDDLNKQIPAHVNLASVWLRIKDYDSAYYHSERALNGSKKLNMTYGIGKSLIVMANTCMGLERYDEGLEHINRSIAMFKEMNIASEINNAMVIKASLLEKDKKYSQVLQVVNEARPYYKDDPMRLHFFREPKYKALKALGRYDEALQEYEQYVKIKDSLFGEDTRKQIVSLEQKYEHEKNQRSIERLKQEAELAQLKTKQRTNQFLAFAGFLLLLIGVILFIVWKNQITSRMKLVQIEQRLNRARINPHFFFNALASMQALALTEDKSKMASYMSKFANVMRKALDSSYEEMISIEEELKFMREYLEVQQLRFPNKFEHIVQCDDSLELNELQIPSMLLQPFVENSIEHGFKSSKEKGELKITINDLKDEVLISVEDNGKEALSEQPKTYKSRALNIIKDRLILFNRRFKTHASYQATQKEESAGYKVSVILPKLYIT